MTRLTGKVAIVTGGAHGIGLACARRLRHRRRRVALGDIDAAAGEAAAEALRGEGAEGRSSSPPTSRSARRSRRW